MTSLCGLIPSGPVLTVFKWNTYAAVSTCEPEPSVVLWGSVRTMMWCLFEFILSRVRAWCLFAYRKPKRPLLSFEGQFVRWCDVCLSLSFLLFVSDVYLLTVYKPKRHLFLLACTLSILLWPLFDFLLVGPFFWVLALTFVCMLLCLFVCIFVCLCEC